MFDFFPICVALRPCNAANEMFKRVTFGLITGGTEGGDGDEDDGGDGILVYTKGVISVYFQGVAFDSAGEMVWPNFTAPLIDPVDPDADLDVKGMHFWARAAVTFPLSRKSKGEIKASRFDTRNEDATFTHTLAVIG